MNDPENLRCLITGAFFVDTEENRCIYGDLHQLFDILILNGNGNEWTSWDEKKDREQYKGAMAVRCSHYYEKNSQVVFPLAMTQFNVPAKDFLYDFLGESEEGKSHMGPLQ